MGGKIDFNNANIIYSNIEETNINYVNISSKNTGSDPAILRLLPMSKKKFLHNLHIIFLSGNLILGRSLQYSIIQL